MPLNPGDWRFTVAPMLDWTDRHCRYFHRLLTSRARLYTEMVTTGAIIHGDRDRLLGFSQPEHPVALQLGGSDPADLAESVRIASAYGYDEYNLNCGCPSERVQKGSFGVCLMLEPQTVAACVRAMQDVTDKPVTVKHRIGVDDHNEYGFVRDFVGTVYDAGCRVFIVHTRSAWLKGLSPKENREVPPLVRETAFRLKKDFPDTVMLINGQIASLDEAKALVDAGMDGVMVGRAAYQNPWMLAGVDEVLYGVEHDGVSGGELQGRRARHPCRGSSCERSGSGAARRTQMASGAFRSCGHQGQGSGAHSVCMGGGLRRRLMTA